MKLGAFSISLAVKDIRASKDFYQKLGFEAIGGEIDQNWLILRNGDTTIGLFQGMFEKNTLTFNPGWDAQCQELSEFDDVRQIQQSLQSADVTLTMKADENTQGPACIMLEDPDGNPIMVDQHR